ncbi:hypothetical protein HQ571_02190 [Candidatus Kuenenbacteria bacterium]|nr:hypothetical protein [Candidatus Kuenenbacteria bacterium]
MKNFYWIFFIVMIISCGETKEKKAQAKESEPVLKQQVVQDDCDRVVQGEIRIIRNGKVLDYLNRSEKPAVLEITSGPHANPDFSIIYDLPAKSGHRLRLPFEKSIIRADIYIKIDQGPWTVLCWKNKAHKEEGE